MTFRIKSLIVSALTLVTAVSLSSQDIKLPAPKTDGGMPVMETLKQRQSLRNFDETKKLSEQTLSNLLWAACGVNRPDGRRTAPTAKNWQEINVYVCTEKGVFVYDAKNNLLKESLKEDLRQFAGKQEFVKKAPVVLVYVAEYSKMGNTPLDSKDFYSAVDTGFISQNVYLFCASEGLSTVVLGYVDKDNLTKVLKLGQNQKIMLTQPVGYPGK